MILFWDLQNERDKINKEFSEMVCYCRELEWTQMVTHYLVHLTASAYLIDNSKHCLNSSSLPGTAASPWEPPTKKKIYEIEKYSSVCCIGLNGDL